MKTNDNEATVIQPPCDESTTIATPSPDTQRKKSSSPACDKDTLYGKMKTVKKAPAVAGAGVTLGSASAIFMTLGDEESPRPAMAAAENSVEETAPEENAPEAIPVEAIEEVIAAVPESSVSDSMSFDQAFAAARAEHGPGSTFQWNGNVYSTSTQEEWARTHGAESQAGGFEADDMPLMAEAVEVPSDGDVEILGVDAPASADVEIEILGVAQEISTGNGIGHLIVEDDDAFVIHVDADSPVAASGLSVDPFSSVGDTPDYLTEIID